MKIGIQTWGSHGDIRPFIALAEGLQSSGHTVSLIITSIDSSKYENLLSNTDVNIQLISSPVIPNRKELDQIEDCIFNESNSIKQTQLIIEKLFLPVESEMYQAAYELCKGNNLVIGHFFHYPLKVAAEITSRPYVSVQLVHSAIPSLFYPPSGLPNAGKFGNRLFWWLVKSVLNKNIKKYSDVLRIKHQLKPAKDLMNDVWSSNQLTLIAVSPVVCEHKDDWPENFKVCGFFNMPNLSLEGRVTDKLELFLANGDAPVYITFGSAMLGSSYNSTIDILRDAVKKSSVRTIIQVPNWHERGLTSTDSIFYVDSLPYSVVFPRCVAVVHHGSAGTVQSVLLAGIPSVVVSHTSEQEFWGRELERISVSSKPLSRRKLTSTQLANEIKFVINSDEIKEKAMLVARAMDKEDGVVTAVKLINDKIIN